MKLRPLRCALVVSLYERTGAEVVNRKSRLAPWEVLVLDDRRTRGADDALGEDSCRSGGRSEVARPRDDLADSKGTPEQTVAVSGSERLDGTMRTMQPGPERSIRTGISSLRTRPSCRSRPRNEDPRGAR